MCDFVCGTTSHAKMLLHWSVIHYQISIEWHSGCGLAPQQMFVPNYYEKDFFTV